MYCPNCASQIHNDVKFCTHCGSNLTTISDLLKGKIIENPQSEELIRLIGKYDNGHLSILIGLGLVITSLLIVITAMLFGALPAAISSLVFLGWAIPAIAQGIGKWRSAKSEIRAILKDRSGMKDKDQLQKSLPAEGAKSDSGRFTGSVTEGTTASLDQRA